MQTGAAPEPAFEGGVMLSAEHHEPRPLFVHHLIQHRRRRSKRDLELLGSDSDTTVPRHSFTWCRATARCNRCISVTCGSALTATSGAQASRTACIRRHGTPASLAMRSPTAAAPAAASDASTPTTIGPQAIVAPRECAIGG